LSINFGKKCLTLPQGEEIPFLTTQLSLTEFNFYATLVEEEYEAHIALHIVQSTIIQPDSVYQVLVKLKGELIKRKKYMFLSHHQLVRKYNIFLEELLFD